MINLTPALSKHLVPARTKILVSAISGFMLMLACCSTAMADIRLPRLISDGAVLQRGTELTLWGWADNNEQVQVYLDGKNIASTQSQGTRWQVTLPSMKAGGPHTLSFVGDNKISLAQIYFGDVWIAAGQSNMELPMERVKYTYSEEISNANHTLIRQFKTPRRHDFQQALDDFSHGEWIAADQDHISRFSAVAYFFAKAVQEQHPVPIGIINTAVGGSKVESWVSEKTLTNFPHLLDQALRYRNPHVLAKTISDDKHAIEQWYNKLDQHDLGLSDNTPWYSKAISTRNWPQIDLPRTWQDSGIGDKDGAVWLRKTVELPQSANGQPGKLWLGRIVDADTTYVNGVEVGRTTYQYPPRRYSIKPGILKAGKNTIAVRVISEQSQGGFIPDKPYWLDVAGKRYSLEGSWHYQIGVVTEPAPQRQFWDFMQPLGFYNAMLSPIEPMDIKGVIWYQGESNVGRADEYSKLMPALIDQWRTKFNQGNFPFLMVQLANYLAPTSQSMESVWAELRDAQRQTLSVDNTALVVAIDSGEWNDLHPLNKKVIGDRLALAARHHAYGEDKLVYSGPMIRCIKPNGPHLTLHFDHVGSGLVSQQGELNAFAIAGSNSQYQWANATLQGNSVEITLPDGLQAPYRVRYAWADNPDRANFYNREGLPASPFESGELCAD